MTPKEKLDALFAEPKKENMIRTGLYLPKELYEDITYAAKANGRSVNSVMVKILQKFMDEAADK